MISSDQLKSIARNFVALGGQRQLALVLIFILIVGSIAAASYLFSKPSMQTLYTGLIKSDVAAIGAVLSQAGVTYEVGSKGESIMVPYGRVDNVRMLLAERGLPHGPSAGYELFDNLGSIGLTSFMQQVTRKRALEGELARTIQAMKGILAARVHLVMAEAGSFRRVGQKPSASVVIRTTSDAGQQLASAVRHLVAASVPGLSMNQVAILNTDGSLLASGGDPTSRLSRKNADLEKEIEASLKQNINETLAPFLGMENFRISVAARLNTDKREIRETAYDPNTRVERSVRVVKESKKSQNTKSSKSVGVQQNVPAEEETGSGDPNQSKRDNERREELTNYEVGSKTVATVSDGYRIERLTVAVVVNNKRIMEALGDRPASDKVDRMLKQVESLVAAAVGLVTKRGDEVKVSAVEFLPAAHELKPVDGLSLMEQLLSHTGALINGIVVLGIVALLIFFGVRPVTKVLLRDPTPAVTNDDRELPSVENEQSAAADMALETDVSPSADVKSLSGDNVSQTNSMMPIAANDDPKVRLERLIEDEDAAVEVMRQWMQEAKA